jgi:hypothetical protein
MGNRKTPITERALTAIEDVELSALPPTFSLQYALMMSRGMFD